MTPEWADEIFRCDNCGYDGPGWFYDIKMRGWKPLCICEDCAEDMKRENE